MSDTDRVKLSYVEETTFGTTPASALTEIRYTGESLKPDILQDPSREIRSDGRVHDNVRSASRASGGVDFDLSYATFDDFIAGALGGTWPGSADSVTATDISADSGDDSFNTVGEDFSIFEAGQWIEVRGFSDSTLNGYFQISDTTAPTTTKIIVQQTLATEAASNSITIKGTMIRDARTRRPFTIEKEFVDIGSQFMTLKGMVVNRMTMNVTAEQRVSGSFDFIGNSVTRAATTAGTGGPTAANTNQVMTANFHAADLREGDATLGAGIFIQSMVLNVNRNARPRSAVGTEAYADIKLSRFTVDGTLTMYFKDGALFDKVLNKTASKISFTLEDDAGNAYVVTVHSIDFSDGEILAGGVDSDAMVQATWAAKKDSDLDAVMQFDRFAA